MSKTSRQAFSCQVLTDTFWFFPGSVSSSVHRPTPRVGHLVWRAWILGVEACCCQKCFYDVGIKEQTCCKTCWKTMNFVNNSEHFHGVGKIFSSCVNAHKARKSRFHRHPQVAGIRLKLNFCLGSKSLQKAQSHHTSRYGYDPGYDPGAASFEGRNLQKCGGSFRSKSES